MKKVVAALTAGFLCVSATGSVHDAGLPPPKYMGQAAGLTIFANDVTDYCGPAPEGMVKLGCFLTFKDSSQVMVVPNPCAKAFEGELFARIACHEKAHGLGWSGMHPR